MYLIVKAPATWTVDTLGTNSPPAVVSYINELITDPSSHKGLTTIGKPNNLNLFGTK
jgi:hypothetical protein